MNSSFKNSVKEELSGKFQKLKMGSVVKLSPPELEEQDGVVVAEAGGVARSGSFQAGKASLKVRVG